MKKQKSIYLFCIILMSIVCVFIMCNLFKDGGIVSVPNEEIILDDGDIPEGTNLLKVSKQNTDINVIPDKYNTGCDESNLTMIDTAGVYDGYQIKSSGTEFLTLDFFYSNKDVNGSLLIKDKDFSSKIFALFTNGEVERDIVVIFQNCKFNEFRGGRETTRVKYVFNNCSIGSYNGSNAEFNSCYFGGTYRDGMNIFQNVVVNNCYFADFYQPTEIAAHIDGVQLYGYKDIDVFNINFNNCRFEVHELNMDTKALMNACIMLQLEYADGYNIHYNDCIINGGGFSIYAWSAKEEFSLTDVSFNNISVGQSCKYGYIYSKTSPNVIFNNVHGTEKLYVGSVWKDENGIHVSVSNDTKSDRTLVVVTDKSTYRFTIEGCKAVNELVYNTSFNDAYPFDLVKTIENAQWVVCYDGEIALENQIRCEVFDGYSKDIYVEQQMESNTSQINKLPLANASDGLLSNSGSIILSSQIDANDTKNEISGSCGNSVKFVLNANKELIFSGIGETYSYHSQKRSEWYEFRESIVDVIINDEITSIGAQLCTGCSSIRQLRIPNTVVKIGDNAFQRCSSLETVYIPQSVNDIGRYAFNETNIKKIYYDGSASDWNLINIGEFNEELMSAELVFMNEEILEGTCGKDVNWKLENKRKLILSGYGETYDYHSLSRTPWYDYRADITEIEIGEGITTLGNQLLDGVSAKEIKLPSTITKIGNLVFTHSYNLYSLYLKNNVTSIGIGAFAETGLSNVFYTGSEKDWNGINILSNNELLHNVNIVYNYMISN